MTLAHWGKKRTRLQFYTKVEEAVQWLETASQILVTASGYTRDDGQKELDKPFKAITEQELASLRAQANELFGNEKVWVEMPRYIARDKVDNPSPQSTPQILPAFEEYASSVTYPEEVKETLGILIEVEPLDHTKLEDLGLNTCSHDLSLSSREIHSVNEPEPQLLPIFSPLDVNLGDKRGPDPPINPYSPGSFRLKVVNQLTIHIQPSPHVAYYHLAIERLKQGESINVQDLETNLYWEFGKFTSRNGESLESYYSRFYKMMNELSQELKTVSYHKLYDILKQHQNEVNELRAERLARIANPLALVAQQQPVYHPQNHPTHYAQNSSTRSQQAATRNKGKTIVNSPLLIYDQEPSMKIYKPTNNNLRTSSNTSRANQDNSPRINKGTGYANQRIGNVAGARETVEVTPDAADNSKPIFDTEPLQQVSNNDNYNVFSIESEHPEQSKYIHNTYLIEQDEHNMIIDSLDMSYDRKQTDQDDDDDLANERDLLASLIEKLQCEIDDIKNRNKFLETSNKILVDKLKGEIADFKTKNKSLESSNNRFKEANNELSKINELMYNDLKKFQAELDRRNDVKYASKVEIDCEKAKGDLISYKMESQKSFNKYTQKINDLNQTISEMKKELSAHQEIISLLSQAKEAHIKLYKTHKDKELDKVIALENKVKVLDNSVYKTGQSVQTMNMLNSKCKTSFAKPEFLKKA
uniref:Ribonuclease H-like domain-containing protein n=1 Tax=Tanacetum cinerariifolium TaxID=118510 RepID=A0A6L2NWC1_TANCI|nr:ribonuclease H-like domain-containing protein [Tanacetum cinerariifolium]